MMDKLFRIFCTILSFPKYLIVFKDMLVPIPVLTIHFSSEFLCGSLMWKPHAMLSGAPSPSWSVVQLVGCVTQEHSIFKHTMVSPAYINLQPRILSVLCSSVFNRALQLFSIEFGDSGGGRNVLKLNTG